MMTQRPFSLRFLSALTVGAALSAGAEAQSTFADVMRPIDVQRGACVSLLGDIDGDSHAEFSTCSFGDVAVYSGRSASIIQVFPNMTGGTSAGDVDGDGVPDLIMRPASFNGTLDIVRGGAWTVLWTIRLPAASTLGFRGVGDVDGDGVDDVGVLESAFSSSATVHVYSGATRSEIFSVPGGILTAIGDVTGDGISEIAAGSTNSIGVYSIGTPEPLFSLPQRFGTPAGIDACEGVGDVDGDTVPDVAMGESYANSATGVRRVGALTVYSGTNGAILQTFFGSAAGQRLGRRIARMGDLNGDGVDEALVGTTERRALVMDLVTGATLASIGGLGHQYNELDAGLDVTGDGVPDGIIGAPQPGTGGNPGFARIVSGATLGLQADEIHMQAVSGGTVNFTADFGPSQAGMLYLILGSLTGKSPGFTFGGVPVPLNPDPYFNILAANPNTFIAGSLGTLDSSGRATAVLSVPPGFLPIALAGATMDHACLVLSSTSLLDASNAMPLTIE